jgi:uncharacterized protein (DUF1778 family)
MVAKTDQLQIRVTPEQKQALKQRAARNGQDVSNYVLTRALPPARDRLEKILYGLSASHHQFWLAELNDLLTPMAPLELSEAVEEVNVDRLSPLLQNYVTAMIELAANRTGIAPPRWAGRIEPLDEPYFAAPLANLRPHLLQASPVPFKRRNIFIDSSLGDRV